MTTPITAPPQEVENRATRRLQVLYTVNDLLKQVVGQGLNIDRAVPEVLRAALDELDAFSGSIIVVNEQLEIQYNWLIAGQTGQRGPSQFMRQAIQEGLFGWVVRTQHPALVSNTQEDRRWLPRPGHPTATSPWSAICVPLIIRSRAIGAITMIRPGEGQFDEEDVTLLSAIANQAASTIESARLYEESQSRARELSALVNATIAMSTSLEVDRLLTTAVEQMTQFTRAEGCAIYEWLPRKQQVSRRTLYLAEDINAERLEMRRTFHIEDYPLTQEILEDQYPVQLHANDSRPGFAEHRYMEAARLYTLLLVPMVAGDQAVGLLEVFNAQSSHRFSSAQIQLAQTLANHTAMALRNARLYEDTQRQLKVMALLNESSRVINSSLHTGEILQSLISQMNELLNAEAISIALLDQQTHELAYEVAEGPGREKIIGLRIPANTGVAGWVARHAAPALVLDTSVDRRFNPGVDRQTGYTTRSIICAPLQTKGEVLGIVQAINRRVGQFDEDDLQLLQNLANLASSALANARQYRRTQMAEARYLSLFEDSINPILLTDEEGHIVEANRRAYEFLGFTRGELPGRSILALHVPGEELESLELIHVEEGNVRSFTSEVRTNDERTIPVEVYVKRTSFQGNDLLQWTYRDITQQVELNQMREDMTAMIVHDLRSPLSNVISSLELLRFELSHETARVALSILDIAERSSLRLQALIRSLLDINHLEAGHPVQDVDYFELSPLFDHAVEDVRPTLERRSISVQIKLQPDLPPTYGDPDMIRRVVSNLLDNAVKYSPDGQEITAEAQYRPDENRLFCAIRDHGRGIPAQYHTTIFQKFRRIKDKDAPKGIGLGLAFCRMAVEGHGGRIWVEDAPGGGARFCFTLPVEPF